MGDSMQQFELTLKNEKKRYYDRFAILLFTLNALGITIALLYTDNPAIGKFEDLGILVASLGSSMFCLLSIFYQKQYKYRTGFLVGIIIITLAWVLIGYWWIALLFAGLLSLFHISQRQLNVIVSTEHVLYPSFPVKKISWIDLSNLVLKDGLLTIDFKNNKIIQQMVDKEKTVVNEKDFNEFCNKQFRSREPGNPKPGILDILGEAGNAMSALDP
jgi:ABC-type antimicrobial peptide transport system permease subunit